MRTTLRRLLVAATCGGLTLYGASHFSRYLGSTQVVVAVHDGDTLTLEGGERIRLSNIDAPETGSSPSCRPTQQARRKRQAWCDFQLGEHSRAYAQALLVGARVAVHKQGTDRYNRTLATLRLEGQDVGQHLIMAGLARPWK